GKMAAHVTHEIRNPLSSMGLNIELLEEELGSAPEMSEAQQLVRAIKREIERLAELSEEYLRVARPPAPHLARENLRALIRGVVVAESVGEGGEFIRPELSKANVVCEVEIAEPLPSVLFDEGQIRQALLNLVRNAREAMQPVGGRLWLRVQASSGGDGIDVVV